MPQTVKTPTAFYRRRWFAILGAVAAMFLLLLAVLPLAISYALQYWLEYNGEDTVSLEDVDFNAFSGKLALTQLTVKADDQRHMAVPRLRVDVDWIPLLSRQVVVRSVLMEGVDLEVDVDAAGHVTIGGVGLPAAAGQEAPSGKPWGFGLDRLEIHDTTVSYRSPDLKGRLQVDSFTLENLKTWATEPAPLVFNGSLNGAALRLEGEMPPLSSGSGYHGRVELNGLGLEAFARIAATAVTGLAGSLTIATDLDIMQPHEGALKVSQTGTVRIDALSLVQADNAVQYGGLAWDGSSKAVLPAGADPQVTLQGTLNGKELAVSMPATGLDLRQGSFRWDGEVSLAPGAGFGVTAEGSLETGDIQTVATGGDLELASIQSLTANRVSLAGDGGVVIAGLQVRAAVFARESQDAAVQHSGPVLAAGAISVDEVRVNDGNQVRIGTLEWRDVTSFVRRDADGQWRVIRILSTLPFAGANKAETTAPAGAELVAEAAASAIAEAPAQGRVQVKELRITGDSALVIDDATVSPPFSMRLNLEEAVIRDLDSGSPEQDSSLLIKGETDRHSHISIEGTIRPFAARPTVDLEALLEGVPLTPLSPFTVAALGYSLQSGQLDTDSSIRINRGELDVSNDLTIRGLEVEPVDNTSREQLDSRLSLPLDTALDMLRDKHNTIRLELPVRGNLDSPDFDISDVVNTAVSKALKQGSMTYLKLALQPYGALITVAELAGEAATKVRLKPVVFEAGSAQALPESADYLEKVAGILKARPEINLRLCGMAVYEDRLALAEQQAAAATAAGKDAEPEKDGQAGATARLIDVGLLELARQRAAAVKDQLVGRHQVQASRLVACQPRLAQAGEEGAPRVDLLI